MQSNKQQWTGNTGGTSTVLAMDKKTQYIGDGFVLSNFGRGTAPKQ